MAFFDSNQGYGKPDEDTSKSNSLCKHLKKHGVPAVVINCVKADEIDIGDIIDYTEEEIKIWCQEHNIKMAPRKKFLKAVKMLPNSIINPNNNGKPSGYAVKSQPNVNNASNATQNNTNDIDEKDEKKEAIVEKAVKNVKNISHQKICFNLFETGCVGSTIEILSQDKSAGSDTTGVQSLYDSFISIWDEYDVPLVKAAIDENNKKSVKNIERYDIKPIYMAIG